MQYMLLAHFDEKVLAAMSPAELAGELDYCEDLKKEMKQAGVFIAAGRLEPTTTASTVRVRRGDQITTDGPFAETKEQLGGFCLVEVADLDEARAWAAKLPPAKFGQIEVRPMAG